MKNMHFVLFSPLLPAMYIFFFFLLLCLRVLLTSKICDLYFGPTICFVVEEDILSSTNGPIDTS